MNRWYEHPDIEMSLPLGPIAHAATVDPDAKPPGHAFPVAALARQAWLDTHRPFIGGRTAAEQQNPYNKPADVYGTLPQPAPGEVDPDDLPNPAYYDPRHATRHRPMVEDPEHPGLFIPAGPAPTTDAKQQVIASIEEAFARQYLTLGDLTPSRIYVAYRVVLSMAMTVGAMRPGESLAHATEISTYDTSSGRLVDPWRMQRPLPETMPLAKSLISTGAASSSDDVDPKQYAYLSNIRERFGAETNAAGKIAYVSLLPPEVPKRWIVKSGPQRGTVHECYSPTDPDHDLELLLYMAAFKGVYDTLGVRKGTPVNKNLGEYGYVGLDNAGMIRQAFPTKAELIAYENCLIDDTLKILVEKDTISTYNWLETNYGLTKRECKWIVQMAQTRVGEVIDTDVDMQKNLMVLKLEDLARRCREGYDKKTEVAVLKQLALVLGITRVEPDDFSTQAAEFLKRWHQQDAEKMARSGNVSAGQVMLSPPAHLKIPPPPMMPEVRELSQPMPGF